MKVDFSYTPVKEFDYSEGYIFKGKDYRCNYVKFPTVYKNPVKGTETIEMYSFLPKDKPTASVMFLHGLGSANVKFLLWSASHLASANIASFVMILPGNYTRVDHKSVSGKNFLYPDLNLMYNFWQFGVVDIRTTIDFLTRRGLWLDNNCIVGYCLGGMLATIAANLEKSINEIVFMTVGGHLPKIMYESPKTKFIRKMVQDGYQAPYDLNNRQKLYEIYDEQLPEVRKMSFDEIVESEEIHPLFKIDPIAYAHLLDKRKITFFEAIWDRTLPFLSRKILWHELQKPKKYVIPTGHVSWLPFEFALSLYLMKKLDVNGFHRRSKLLARAQVEDSSIDDIGK